MELRDFSINSSKIKIMPASLANKIAAGEVVERPASVVKELVENSIDAEANKISIVIKQSGKKLIQVIDNGSGMTPEDIQLALKRHATSKIISDADLNNIHTLGFRGEALPSIASVSQVEIKSKITGDSIGSHFRFEGGEVRHQGKTACPEGTNIEIKNLFYNTPARRNFLRSDAAEFQQIVKVIKRLFLAYPDVSFEFISEDDLVYSFSAGSIEERVKAVFGKELMPALISFSESLGGIELSGFISRPDVARKSRGNQYIFLNGRPIQDKSLNHAVFQGYGNLVHPGEYPTFCLFLEIDPKLVDVNVHPTKMEVRFSNERSLYYFFLSSVRKALNSDDSIPEMVKSDSDAFVARFDLSDKKENLAQEFKAKSRYMAGNPGQSQLSLAYFDPKTKTESEPEQPVESRPADVDVEVRFWQIHNRYILSEIKSGMVLIDQHVAHERILFEKMLAVLNREKSSAGQQLLFPQTVTLTVDDSQIFSEIKPVLEAIGFSLREFSGNSIVIDAIPSDVKVGRETQIVLDMIDYYRENPLREFNLTEKVAAAFACKNAVKSGEKLSQAQMHALVDQLFACESPYFCPHGRPVIITMGLEEIDRKFKRIN